MSYQAVEEELRGEGPVFVDDLVQELQRRATVKQATHLSEAVSLLRQLQPDAVFITHGLFPELDYADYEDEDDNDDDDDDSSNFDETYYDEYGNLTDDEEDFRKENAIWERMKAKRYDNGHFSDNVEMQESNRFLASLVDYTKQGGRVVFGSSFSSFILWPDVGPLFASWDLPWTSGSYTKKALVLNPCHTSLKTSNLEPKYFAKALFLQNVDDAAKLYMSEPVSDPDSDDDTEDLGPSIQFTETFAAFTSVGRGFVGYLGDVNPGTTNERVIIAMCGLEDHPDQANRTRTK